MVKINWKNVLLVVGAAFLFQTNMIAQKSFPKNQVIAHRGAWQEFHLPENSIASLQKAIEIGCYGSEFDVHLTADDSLIVIHNDDYEGMSIEKSTYAQLASKPMSNGESLPTLHQYLAAGMQQNKTKLILEIKKSVLSDARTIELTQKVVNAVHQMKADKWIVYISFDYPACLKVRALDKKANIEFLNAEDSSYTPEKIKADKLNGLDYYYKAFYAFPNWITAAQKLKLDLNAWTVNEDTDLNFFLDKNFNFITTNRPQALLKMIDARRAQK